MNSSFCLWLAEVEETVWRMIRGVFRFTFQQLPEWLHRLLLDTVGPAVIRVLRVLVVLCLWLAVVFGPVAGAVGLRLPLWVDTGAVLWVLLAIAGSIWGRAHLPRKRQMIASVPLAGLALIKTS